MTPPRPVPNYIIDEKIDLLAERFARFEIKYELDMRGDKNVENGKGGVVGAVRKIQEHVEKYPSLTYLLATKPVKTVVAVMMVFAVLMVLWGVGIYGLVVKLLGYPWPLAIGG